MSSGAVAKPGETLADIVARLVRVEELVLAQQKTIVALLRAGKRKTRSNSPPVRRRDDDDDDVLTIHTDGSSLNNGRRAAAAGCGFSASDGRKWTGACPGKQTNQRAELYAAVRALVYAREAARVHIASDSEYVVLGVNEPTRLRQWAGNGWRTKARSPVANRDLWQQLLAEMTERERRSFTTEFSWVKAHAGNAANEEADQLAVHAAKRSRGAVRE
jgi:ribonuclease HI